MNPPLNFFKFPTVNNAKMATTIQTSEVGATLLLLLHYVGY